MIVITVVAFSCPDKIEKNWSTISAWKYGIIIGTIPPWEINASILISFELFKSLLPKCKADIVKNKINEINGKKYHRAIINEVKAK